MTEALTAARDLLVAIPLKIRQTTYGLFGLVILMDSIWGFVPDRFDSQLVGTFAAFGFILALANTTEPKKPEPKPDTP